MTAADPIRLPNAEVLDHGVEVGSCVGGGCGGLVGTGDVGKVVGPGWVGGGRAIVGLAVVTNSGVAVGLGGVPIRGDEERHAKRREARDALERGVRTQPTCVALRGRSRPFTVVFPLACAPAGAGTGPCATGPG